MTTTIRTTPAQAAAVLRSAISAANNATNRAVVIYVDQDGNLDYTYEVNYSTTSGRFCRVWTIQPGEWEEAEEEQINERAFDLVDDAASEVQIVNAFRS